LELSFGHRTDWPRIQFQPDRLGYRTNWTDYAFLALTVSNPTDAPARVNLRIDSAIGRNRCRQGGIDLAPEQKARVLFPIGRREPIIGMRGQPPPAYGKTPHDVQIPRASGEVEWQRVSQFQIFMGRPEMDHTIHLHRVELIRAGTSSRTAFVDRFGQYSGTYWPGKLQNEAQLSERLSAEEAYFAANPPLPDRNAYGGWKDGPQLEETGHFRVCKRDGKWWLVDPDGRLFWSSGITCVRFNGDTIIADREKYFEWLPEKDDPLTRFYSGWKKRRMFDFFEANAFRKYGANYVDEFYEVTMRRFQSWGINTIANWSAPEAWRLKRVPYTVPIGVPRAPSFVATSHVKAGLEKKKYFPDPFNPKFQQILEEQLAANTAFKNDPWLLGVFIHNELPWTMGASWQPSKRAPTGIGALCLQKSDERFMAKRKLIDWLTQKHGETADLNRAWGTSFPDWQAMNAPFELTDAQRRRALPDLLELDKLIAQQYFRVCREALDKHLPGVLYLGCRFSNYDRHIVQVAKQYCDVVCFNIYAESPSDRTVDELATELDFPVVIGEFHFGALDRGMFDPGLRRTKNQNERAERYAAYIREAATASWCVGAHWFQYVDQALTGRADGENYNIGFVDVSDDPYPEMRAAARRVHRELYSIR